MDYENGKKLERYIDKVEEEALDAEIIARHLGASEKIQEEIRRIRKELKELHRKIDEETAPF